MRSHPKMRWPGVNLSTCHVGAAGAIAQPMGSYLQLPQRTKDSASYPAQIPMANTSFTPIAHEVDFTRCNFCFAQEQTQKGSYKRAPKRNVFSQL